MTRVLAQATTKPEEGRALRPRRGRRLGRYELLHPIAAGGMAEVWAAEQHGDFGFGKLVALKLIRSDCEYNQTFRAMFVDEALVASRIKHPNVVETLDLGSDDGALYHAMTLVEGSAIGTWLAQSGHRLPIGIALRIAIDLLSGLEAAHELRGDDGARVGVVHRDVSPQNVLVGVDGIARLADFGIAKALERCCVEECLEPCCTRRSAYETGVGRVRGKLGYLAPEVLGGAPATRSSDLYAVGIVLWEMVTGQRLFDVGSDDAPRARKRMRVRDPREVASDLPAALAETVMRALAKTPEDRFASAREMAEALFDVAAQRDAIATHADVAALLEADMGSAIREKQASIAVARRESQPPPAAGSGTYAREWEPATTQPSIQARLIRRKA